MPTPAHSARADHRALIDAVIAGALASAAAVNADAPARRLRYALNAKGEAKDTIRDIERGRWCYGGWPNASDLAGEMIDRFYRRRHRRVATQIRKAA